MPGGRSSSWTDDHLGVTPGGMDGGVDSGLELGGAARDSRH